MLTIETVNAIVSMPSNIAKYNEDGRGNLDVEYGTLVRSFRKSARGYRLAIKAGQSLT